LRELLNTLLITARSLAKDMIFGIASTNCKYILALKDELEPRGNFVEVLFFNRKKAIDCLMLVVINKEVRKRKAAGTNAAPLGTKPGAKMILAFCAGDSVCNIDIEAHCTLPTESHSS
jgi:hypothetical protein